MADPRTLAPMGQGDPRAVAPMEDPLVAPMPEDRDAAAYRDTSNSFSRGARSGFNQMAGGVSALAGLAGDTMGLTDFAASRFAEADQFAKFADSVAPDTRDYRQVKDFNSLVDFVGGLGGQAAASFVPAVLGGGVGAVAGGGLRGAMIGLGAGSFVPNAGEQAQAVRSGPGTSGEKLANSVGVGAVNAFLDTMGTGRVAKQIAQPGGRKFLKELGKTTAVEAGTEGAQTVVGQAGQTMLNPNRDKSGDTAEIINSVIGGAVGGAGLQAAGSAASFAPGAVADTVDSMRKRFGKVPELKDENDLSDIISNPDLKDPEAMLAAIDGKDAEAEKSWRDVFDHAGEKFKEKFGSVDEIKAAGSEKIEEFKTAAKQYINDAKDKPLVQRALAQVKAASEAAKAMATEAMDGDSTEPKKSLQRTGIDLALHDAVMKMIPERTRMNLTPAERMELSAAVKHAALHSAGSRTDQVGPQPGARATNEGFPTSDQREQDRPTEPNKLPSGLLHLLGPDAVKIIQGAQAVLKSGGIPFKGDAPKAVGEAVGRVRARKTAIESIIHEHLKDDYLDDPEMRKAVTDGFANMLDDPGEMSGNENFWVRAWANPDNEENRRVNPSAQRLMEAAGYIFKDRAKAMNALQAHMSNEGFAREFTLTDDDLNQYGIQQDGPTESDEHVDQDDADGFNTRRDHEGTVFNDERLRTYDDLEQARQAYRALEEDYPHKEVQIRHEMEQEYNDETGQMENTGRVTLHAESRDGSDALTPVEWSRIVDKSPARKAGFEHGTLTVKRTDGKIVRVSLKALTEHAAKTLDRPGQARRPYPHDVVMHGLTTLLSDKNVESVAESNTRPLNTGKKKVDVRGETATMRGESVEIGPEQWDIPPDTVVGTIHKREYTWGEITKMAKLTPVQLSMRQMVENAVEAAEQADSLLELERRDEEHSYGDPEYDPGHLQFAEDRAARLKRAMENAPEQPEGKFKGGSIYRIAAMRYERQLGVVEKIYEEIARREKDGDFPKMQLGSLDIDKGMAEASEFGHATMRTQDPTGPRHVQEETGSNLLGGRDRERGSGYQPHEVGLRPQDTAHGPEEHGVQQQPKTPQDTATDLDRPDQATNRNTKAPKFTGRESTLRPFPQKAKVDEAPKVVPPVAIEQAFRDAQAKDPKLTLDQFMRDVSGYTGGGKKMKALQATLAKWQREQAGYKFSKMGTKDEEPDADTVRSILEALDVAPRDNETLGKFLARTKSAFDELVTSPDTFSAANEVLSSWERVMGFEEATLVEAFGTKESVDGFRKIVSDTRKQISGASDNLNRILPRESDVRVKATGPISEADKTRVRDYVTKVLGDDKVATKFIKGLEHAGDFAKVDGVETLRISTLALDPMGAARHEAAHALIARLLKSDKAAAQQLLAAAGSANVITRLRGLLKGHDKAIEQLADAEERLAYMYQFWAAGQLSVGPKTKTYMDKMRGFFRTLAGLWSETFHEQATMDKAEAIFDLFDRGELSDRNTVAEVLRDKLPKAAFQRATELMGPVWKFFDKGFSTSDGYVRSLNIPAFNAIADKMFTPQGKMNQGPGFNQAKHVTSNRFLTRVTDVLKGADEATQREALESMQADVEAKTVAARKIVAGIRPILDDMFDYMQTHKVKAVQWNDETSKYEEHELREVLNYFPRYYDKQSIVAQRPEFLAMLKKNGFKAKDADNLYNRLVQSTQADPQENDEQVGLTYYAPNTQSRQLDIPAAELAPFLRKDLYGTLESYIRYTSRRSEYAVRFGNQGQEIKKAVEHAIKHEGANEEQVKDFGQAVQAWEGSLGHDVNPQMKRIFGAVITYQNLRLLPLALFSSLVDPLGVVVRGGTVADAFGTFARGIRGIVSESKDEGYDLSLTVGSITQELDAHMLADAYGSQYMTGWQRKINDTFFKLNGMESWNRQMRVGATVAARDFLIRHKTKPNEHSERMLAELNLKASDIKVKDGELDVSSEKIKDAINLWVDGAILRPNAAIRPIWMSDPHWMLVSHLKQYTYSFQKTIISRIVHEAGNGNYTPAYALMSYVPMIIAADVLRAFMTPGGGDDDTLKKLDMRGIMVRGVQRAGLVGPGQYAMDAFGDMGHEKAPLVSLAGPTGQQLYDLASAAAKPGGDLATQVKKAIPGYVLVK